MSRRPIPWPFTATSDGKPDTVPPPAGEESTEPPARSPLDLLAQIELNTRKKLATDADDDGIQYELIKIPANESKRAEIETKRDRPFILIYSVIRAFSVGYGPAMARPLFTSGSPGGTILLELPWCDKLTIDVASAVTEDVIHVYLSSRAIRIDNAVF